MSYVQFTGGWLCVAVTLCGVRTLTSAVVEDRADRWRCHRNEDDIWLRLELDEYLRGLRLPRGLPLLLELAPGPAILVGWLPLVQSDMDHACPPLAAEMGNQEHVPDGADSAWV